MVFETLPPGELRISPLEYPPFILLRRRLHTGVGLGSVGPDFAGIGFAPT
jgi:hypothetical protein